MAFGATFKNDNDVVTIDSERPVLSLMNKGESMADTAIGYNNFGYTKVLTFTNRQAPLLAISVDKPASGDKGFQIIKVERTGSTWSYTILIWTNAGVDFSFRWYLFDIPYGTTPSGYGLATWDAMGRCTFNSAYPPARVASSMTSGRVYAATGYGRLDYQENFDWDSVEMQPSIQWSLWCNPIATYPSAGSMSGALAGGVDWQPPNFPELTAGTLVSLPIIYFDVTGYIQSGDGPPPGYDWLVHPDTFDQLTWGGDPLVWPA
jgi:hypothetical protein